MVPASSTAFQKQQRDVLGVITGLLLFLGLFGVVMHGMPSNKVLHAKATPDLSGIAPQPEVKTAVTTVPPTVPPTAPPTTATPKYATRVFRASFPVPPVHQSHEFAIDNFKMPMEMYLTDQPDRLFAVAYFDMPADATVDLNRAAQGSAVGGGGTLKSTIPTTFHGYKAVEATISVEGGTLRELIVRTPTRVFLIMGGGEGDPAKEFYDFRDSVEIL